MLQPKPLMNLPYDPSSFQRQDVRHLSSFFTCCPPNGSFSFSLFLCHLLPQQNQWKSAANQWIPTEWYESSQIVSGFMLCVDAWANEMGNGNDSAFVSRMHRRFCCIHRKSQLRYDCAGPSSWVFFLLLSGENYLLPTSLIQCSCFKSLIIWVQRSRQIFELANGNHFKNHREKKKKETEKIDETRWIEKLIQI